MMDVVKTFKKEANDPVRTYFVSTSENKSLTKKLKSIVGSVKEQGDGTSTLVVWRPKRRKFRVVTD